jgi:hypothetical protein
MIDRCWLALYLYGSPVYCRIMDAICDWRLVWHLRRRRLRSRYRLWRMRIYLWADRGYYAVQRARFSWLRFWLGYRWVYQAHDLVDWISGTAILLTLWMLLTWHTLSAR